MKIAGVTASISLAPMASSGGSLVRGGFAPIRGTVGINRLGAVRVGGPEGAKTGFISAQDTFINKSIFSTPKGPEKPASIRSLFGPKLEAPASIGGPEARVSITDILGSKVAIRGAKPEAKIGSNRFKTENYRPFITQDLTPQINEGRVNFSPKPRGRSRFLSSRLSRIDTQAPIIKGRTLFNEASAAQRVQALRQQKMGLTYANTAEQAAAQTAVSSSPDTKKSPASKNNTQTHIKLNSETVSEKSFKKRTKKTITKDQTTTDSVMKRRYFQEYLRGLKARINNLKKNYDTRLQENQQKGIEKVDGSEVVERIVHSADETSPAITQTGRNHEDGSLKATRNYIATLKYVTPEKLEQVARSHAPSQLVEDQSGRLSTQEELEEIFGNQEKIPSPIQPANGEEIVFSTSASAESKKITEQVTNSTEETTGEDTPSTQSKENPSEEGNPKTGIAPQESVEKGRIINFLEAKAKLPSATLEDIQDFLKAA